MTLKLQSRTPWLLQDCTSLPAGFGLTAESGLNERLDNRAVLAQVPSRYRDASLLQLYVEGVEIKKLSHAQLFSPARIWRRGKAGVDTPLSIAVTISGKPPN